MRALSVLVLLAACGKKAPPEEAAPAPVAAPAPAPEPEPEPVPETAAVMPPSQRPHNSDFTAAIGFADGTNQKGKVVRVERTVDWFGDEGWADDPNKLKVTLEGGGTEIEVPWSEIVQVDIVYGDKTDVDCTNDSSFTPAMYQCALRTTTKVKTKDGKTWDAADRHKWMFVFESGDAHEFFISKLTERKQEEAVPGLGTVEENAALYEALQAELMKKRVGKVPKSITISAS